MGRVACPAVCVGRKEEEVVEKVLLVGLNCSHMTFILWHQSPILSTLVLSLSLILSVKIVDRFHGGRKGTSVIWGSQIGCNAILGATAGIESFFISYFRYGAQSNRPKLLLQAGPGDENQFNVVSMEITQNVSRWQQNTYIWTCWWTLNKRWSHLIYF